MTRPKPTSSNPACRPGIQQPRREGQLRRPVHHPYRAKRAADAAVGSRAGRRNPSAAPVGYTRRCCRRSAVSRVRERQLDCRGNPRCRWRTHHALTFSRTGCSTSDIPGLTGPHRLRRFKLDDPSFPASTYGNLFSEEENDRHSLIWSPPTRRNDDKGPTPYPACPGKFFVNDQSLPSGRTRSMWSTPSACANS